MEGKLRSYMTYDKNGNIVFHSTDVGGSVRYDYDSIGLLIKKETRTGDGGFWIDSLSYRFDREGMMLRQKWSNNKIEYRFFFANNGRVQQSVRLDSSGRGRMERINYMYDDDLLQKSLLYVNNEGTPHMEWGYYYSPTGILDSVILKTDYGHRQKWVYDSLGLLIEEWFSTKANTRFIHKRRV
jgi:YD repeat-containing protein